MSHRSRLPQGGNGGSRWRQTTSQRTPQAPSRLDDAPRNDGAIAWLRTLIAKGPQRLQRHHLRRRPHAAAPERLHVILLDTSGSMRRHGRLALAKGHAVTLIEQAARAAEQVALISFGGHGVELLLSPGPARAARAARVRPVGGGGGTPLAEALAHAGRVLDSAARRNATIDAWLWLLTDGRTLEEPHAPANARRIVIVDFDEAEQAIGRCADWAVRWRAEHRHAVGSHQFTGR